MSEKIAITKAGYDILGTAGTVVENLTYSSDYNTLKYYTSGSASLTLTSDGTIVKKSEGTVAHNLGYTPFFICYVNDLGSGLGPNSYNIVYASRSTGLRTINASSWVDGTNLYYQLVNSSTIPITANFSFKIFRNNLGL